VDINENSLPDQPESWKTFPMSSMRLLFAILLLPLAGFQTSLFADAATQPKSTEQSAGWAEVEITPPLSIHLGGRGGPITKATKVLDPLYAQVTYLKDAKGTGLVLLSLDTVGISHELSDRIRAAIVRELGVQYNLVVVNCSHTHSGPYMIRDLMAAVDPMPEIESEYFKSLTDKLISATRTARTNLTPVTVEVFEGTSKVGINRRGKNKQGKLGIIPDPNGPINEKLWVMKLTPVNGKASALIFSYSCHPVIVYEYAGSAISADFPGVTRNTLREQLGKELHCQFIQGTAGDIRPRILADLEKNRFRAPKPADLQQAGHDLAEDIMTALKNNGTKLNLNIAGTMDRPFLPRDKPPGKEIYEAMAKEEKSKYRQAVAQYWLPKYETGEGFSRGDAWPLGLIRLADNQWVVYSGGEPCAEWVPKITEWLRLRHLVVWGYSQESNSYLPTEEMLPAGGYEVNESNHTRISTPAAFAPGINEAFRQSLLRQAAFIEAPIK
jgi:neutral ceramidase